MRRPGRQGRAGCVLDLYNKKAAELAAACMDS
jgi:hypothetical protein